MRIRKTIFGKRRGTPINTYIGGLGAVITTASGLATKLGISSYRISNFTVQNNEIQCGISGNYTIPNSCFQSSGFTANSPTSYMDMSGLVARIGNAAFYGSLNTIRFYFPNATSVGTACFYHANYGGNGGAKPIELLYLPKVTTLGNNITSDENIFGLNTRTTKLYTNDYLRTVNSENPDYDITKGAALGVNTTYITDFSVPNKIEDLSIGTVYCSALQLNFTPPSSSNTIAGYECYINNQYVNTISHPGQYVKGLSPNTNYQIKVIAFDIFYNLSESNEINASTNSLSTVPTNNLVSYYNFNEATGTILTDLFGINNGSLNNGVLVNQNGKIGASHYFDGIDDYTDLGNPLAFQLNTGALVFWINNNTTLDNPRPLIGKSGAFSVNLVYGSLNNVFELIPGNWYFVVYNFGVGTNNSQLYVNNKLVQIKTNIVTTQANPLRIGENLTSKNLNAKIDTLSIHNTKLTTTEIDLMWNIGKGVLL